ncbi:MAG: hypothetical protein JXC32_10950 [Anaerolineae bacterium]|nr:hypothetical protein [Anaerolineae bacterium]
MTSCGRTFALPQVLPTGPGAEWTLVVIDDSSLWGPSRAVAAQIVVARPVYFEL